MKFSRGVGATSSKKLHTLSLKIPKVITDPVKVSAWGLGSVGPIGNPPLTCGWLKRGVQKRAAFIRGNTVFQKFFPNSNRYRLF